MFTTDSIGASGASGVMIPAARLFSLHARHLSGPRRKQEKQAAYRAAAP